MGRGNFHNGKEYHNRDSKNNTTKGINENGMWKKFKGEKRDFTKSDRDNFLEERGG